VVVLLGRGEPNFWRRKIFFSFPKSGFLAVNGTFFLSFLHKCIYSGKLILTLKEAMISMDFGRET